MPQPQQPIDRVPDLAADGFVAGWLNKGVLGMGDCASDYGPGGYDMTRVGAPRQERVGMHFTAASTHYLRNATADWRSGDSIGTITAWIKRDSVGAAHTIFGSSNEVGNNNWFFFKVEADNVLHVFQRDNDAYDDVEGSTILAAGVWYHVALVSTGTAWLLYVNGELETPNVIAGANTGDWLAETTLRDSITIGVLRRVAVSEHFNGSIKDVRYHSTALSADEIAYDYSRGVPDDDLRLSLDGRAVDLTRYGMAFARQADVIVGHEQSYDGTGDYLKATAAAWRGSDGLGTLEAWVRPADVAKGMAIFASCDEGTDDYIFEWAITAAGVQFLYALENTVLVGSVTGTTAMLQDVWQHLVIVSTGSAYLFYRNGVLDALAGGGTDSGAWLADVTLRDNVTVGGLEYNSGLILPWEGQISRVKYYSRVMSADEVAMKYAREEPAY